MRTGVYAPWPGAQIIPGDHQQWQTASGNRDGVYEPEHLVEMYVSLDYSIYRYFMDHNGVYKLSPDHNNLTFDFKCGV